MKNIIKYILFAVFALVQVQAFAFNNASDLWKKKDKSYKNDFDFNFFQPKLVSKVLFFGTSDLVLSSTVTNSCVINNSNSHTYTFTVTNTGATPVVLSATNKIFVFVEMPSNSTGGFNTPVLPNLWEYTTSYDVSDANYDYTFTYPSSGVVTIESNQSVSFQVSRNYNISGSEGSRILYSNLSYAGEIISEASAEIFKKPIADYINRASLTSSVNNPIKIHPQTCYTILSAISLTAPQSVLDDIGQYKFYYNNTEISQSTQIKVNSSNQIAIGVFDANNNLVYNYQTNLNLQYSKALGSCESDRKELTISVDTSTKPSPGTIVTSTPKICFGGSVTIRSDEDGLPNGTSGSIEYYTWEISYNDGECWEVPVNSSLITINNDNSNPQIRFTNLTQNVKVRRKYKRGSNTNSSFDLNYSYTAPLTIEVVNNEISFVNNFDVYYVRLGDNLTLPTAITTLPSVVTLKNSDGDEITNYRITPLVLGEYIYTYTAKSNVSGVPDEECTSTRSITVVVYNATDCNLGKKYTYATNVKSWTSGIGGVANPLNAVNNNNANYATLTSAVSLLGIGTLGVDLYFTKPNPLNPSERILVTPEEMKGKKVTIKLGEQYSGLKLAGGLSVKGITTNRPLNNLSVAPIDAGAAFGVKGGVLDLLKGDNVFEFSFIPATSITSTGTPVGYQGVRVQLGSLLGVADLATVFRAYVEEDYEVDLTIPCSERNPEIIVNPPVSLEYPNRQKGFNIINTNIKLNPFVEDITWGNYTEVLNVATGLSSVTFPYYAVDDDYNSYAIFNTTAGVLNKQFLKAKLRRDARPGDQIQIVLGTEGVNILNLGLLNLVNYKVKFYKDDVEVGSVTLDRFKVLDLGLLRFEGVQKAIISAPVSGMFDYVQLEQWNTINVNLGNQLHVYDIRVNPTTMLAGQDDTKTITNLCVTDYLKIRKTDYCSDYEVSFAIATFADGLNGRPKKQLVDEQGNNMVDQSGNPIYELYDVANISDSSLGEPIKIEDNIAYYEFLRLYSEVGGNLMLKIQTLRQGCNYGEPQYLRVRLQNCDNAIVNPVINSRTNY